MNAWWIATLVPAAACALLIAMLRRASWIRWLHDHPNERSLHAAPVPRVGGLCLIIAAFPFAAVTANATLAVLLLAASFLAVVSLADDVRSLPIEVRLPAHAVAAGLAVLSLGAASSWGWIHAALWLLAIVWMTNLFNFMDGSDGLAGGMAAIGFGALAWAAHAAGADALALASASIASAAVGFLAHNFPPARIFLGDAGSIPLGFLAGAVSAYGTAEAIWPVWFPLLVFSPFIADATVTLLRRLLRGERVWKAHRSHAYQRLVLSGWTHRRLALCAYALMLAAAASALWALGEAEQTRWAIILAWSTIYLSLLFAIEMRSRNHAST